jgi:hypothetical protein
MAEEKSDGVSATWSLLTNLLDLLVDKGVLSNQDLLILAEVAHDETSTKPGARRKKSASRLKALREKVKARG